MAWDDENNLNDQFTQGFKCAQDMGAVLSSRVNDVDLT